jgi:hypothetical protein
MRVMKVKVEKVKFAATLSQATGVLDVKVAKQASSGLQEGSGLTSSSGEKHISRTSVADPHHLDADPYDIFPFDADPFLIQIGSVADPDSYLCFGPP